MDRVCQEEEGGERHCCGGSVFCTIRYDNKLWYDMLAIHGFLELYDAEVDVM